MLPAVLALAAPPADAQQEAFCHVTGVETKQLSNAVRVTIEADGALAPAADWLQFFIEEDGDFDERVSREFSFRLTNARSAVGAFADVGLYPISHLEIAVDPESAEGVGLIVRLVLYRPFHARKVDLGEVDFGWDADADPGEFDIILAENKRSIIITAISDRLAITDGPRALRAAREGLETHLDVGPTDGGLSIRALNAPIRDLCRAVARETGSRVVVGGDVARLVTMELDSVPVDELLATVCRAYGLGLTPLDGGYLINEGMATATASYHVSETRRIPVRHLAARNASDLLPNFLEPYVHVDPEHNALVVTGPRWMLEKIAADIARIDQPWPMIGVEAIVVALGRRSDLEADLGLHFVDGTVALGWDSQDGDIAVRVAREPQELRARLQALSERGWLKALSRPRVLVANGDSGVIFVGEERFFTQRSSGRGQEVYLTSVPVGVRLRVRPWTGSGELIRLDLSVRASIVERVSSEGLPTVSVREAGGDLWVANDELVVIGGLQLAEFERMRRKIPVLGDLPLLGSAFRSTRLSKRFSEVAIFVRAWIPSHGSPADDVRSPAPAAGEPRPPAGPRPASPTPGRQARDDSVPRGSHQEGQA